MINSKVRSYPEKIVWRREFRRWSILVLLAELSVAGVSVISPLVQKIMIDSANSAQAKTLIHSAIVLAVLLIGQFALRSLSRYQRGCLNVKVRQKLKGAIFRHLLALPEDFLRSRGVGYFFNRIQHDVSELAVYVVGNGLSVWGDLVKLCAALGVIFCLDWRCAVLGIPFLLMQGMVCYFFRQRQYNLSRELQECAASEDHIIQDFLQNQQTLKVHTANDSAGARIEHGLRHWGSLMLNKLNYENIFMACLQMPIYLCSGIIVVIGLYMVIKKQVTLGEVWALLMLMNQIFTPSRMLGSFWVQRQSAGAAWDRLQEIMQQDPENEVAPDEKIMLQGDLEIADLCFGYTADQRILRNLNLRLNAGSGVFLCGANGSGKSTLFALLLRLYSPQQGAITVGGRNIETLPLNSYRSRIGYIGQHPEFIAGTLRENLLLGNGGISDSEIMQLFERLDCLALVERLPAGLDSLVMERGENFSGGERLRLALVRELLRDTDWLLFDEAAASLDTAGRQKFYELLQHLPGNKTVIAIAHDLPENSSWPVLHLEELQK